MRVRIVSDDGLIVELRHDGESYTPSVMRELCDHARRLLAECFADHPNKPAGPTDGAQG